MDQVIDISGDGGILKQIIKEGTGPQIPEHAKAKVHYVGTFEDGKKFDSSRDRKEPFTFTLGTNSVIKGWDIGVATMKEGELAILTCRFDYAYGENGSEPVIPPKATLKFEVELLGWEDPEPSTAEEKIKAAIKKKDEGNQLFKEGKYNEALQSYSNAIDYFKNSFGFSEDEKKRADEVKLPCFLNLAATQLRTKDYSDCVLNCHKALDIDSNNVKALFRRGQAYSRLNDFDKAKSDFTEVIQLAPDNKEVRQELDILKKKIISYKQQEKQMFSNIFANPTKTESKKDISSESKEINT